MNLFYQDQLPQDFSSSSRVWIYQSSRAFSSEEIIQLKPMLQNFASNWKSHGTPVKGFADIIFNYFIILMADENATGVSGCSTDSSVRLIKEIEQLYRVDMFNRQTLAYLINDKIELLPLSQFKTAVSNNVIASDTLYFNNLVSTKRELIENWIIPVKESWLSSRLSSVEA